MGYAVSQHAVLKYTGHFLVINCALSDIHFLSVC